MEVSKFENEINALKFSFIKQKEDSGVILTDNLDNISSELCTPEILFALETAKEKYKADAVYFRFFEDSCLYKPQIYIFNNLNNKLDKNSLHSQMWSGFQVPLYIIIEKNSVHVFDSRQKPNINKEEYAEDIIKTTGLALKEFNQKNFDSGLFWEELYKINIFQFENSVTKDLIKGLKDVYKNFQEQSGLGQHIALKLLVQCLLIKYLEERDEKSKSGYFAKTYFRNYFQCENFCDTIRNGRLLDLLDQLSKDFNGKIFEWNKEKETEERNAIQNSTVAKLADFLDGNIEGNQYVLWRMYSFSHLPIEVISSVYEVLLTKSKDIVYTPEMVVNTMIDECMPLEEPKEDFKLIDVSCGSGIFLVKAFKRIVEWWRYQEWKKTGILKKPTLYILKELLEKHIFGIDIQEDAVSLAIFSLALAVLDEVDLNPPLWEELKFPDLSKNIIKKDFFEFITNKPESNYDLVIGNPPFNLQKVDGKEQRGKHFQELKNKYGYQSDIKIPDENPALHFLVQSMRLLKEDALLCMIQPSGPLLYQKDLEFRKDLFTKYNLLQVIDFTKLGDILYESRNVATAAVFLNKSAPDNDIVLHLIANRTFTNLNKIYLEFDYYDFHLISKESILNNFYIWKANLLGGGRIADLIERLSKHRTLGEYIKSKAQDGWAKGEGFIESSSGKPCSYITGMNFLPTDAMTENKLDKSKIKVCEIQKFHRAKDKIIYTQPHILIRSNIGNNSLILHFLDEYIVFKNKIISIHSPEVEKNLLLNMYNYLKANSSILRAYILLTSSQIKVNRFSVPMTEDFMNLPYPENISELKISYLEKLLIDEVNINFSSELNSSTLTKQFNINDYSNIFCETLNSIYATEDNSFQLFKVLDAGKFFAVHFIYTDEKNEPKYEEVEDLEEYIDYAIPTRKENNERTHIQKIMKVYGHNTIILGKPKQLRYWLQSIALRDADETLTDYIKARYYDAEEP